MKTDLPVIRIVDTAFAHGVGLGCGDLTIPPTKFNYYRGNEQVGDIVLVTDGCLNQVHTLKEKIKIAWLLEPPCIHPELYTIEKAMELMGKFNLILTHQKKLHDINPQKFVFYPYAGCWIYPNDWKIYQKTKQVSIIASGKRETQGHQLRHLAIERYANKIEGIYGNAYKFVKYKLEALKDYKYSIVIENEKSDYWFTEKLIDCFATGVVPIYFGAPSITKLFHEKGMIIFDTIEQLGDILKNLPAISEKAIRENFLRAKQYAIPEDWIFETYLKQLI